MGLFDRFKQEAPTGPPAKLMSDGQAAALKEKQDLLGAFTAANPGAMPDMSDPKALQAWAAQQATDAQMIQRVQAVGVEAPAVIRSLHVTEQVDLGGGTQVEAEVSIRPAGGMPHDARVRQSMTPAQLQGLSAGARVTVKYDPSEPGTALLVGW